MAAHAAAVGLRLRVAAAEDDAEARTFTLMASDGQLLPAYVPGSHVVVDCGRWANAYSLLDDGAPADRYRISVLHLPEGSGGSRWLHETLRVGDEVEVSLPRSHFPPVANARRLLLIAAGIGITPILSHARAARRWGRGFTLLYRYRAGRGSHLAELRALCGADLEEVTERAAFSSRLAELLTTQPLGTQLFVCGPAAFTHDVLSAAAVAGWPAGRLHTEQFAAADLDPGRAFSVRLRDGTELGVPAGVPLLEVLESQGIAVSSWCRQGVCGECRITVVRGDVEHRDLYLSEYERSSAASMMCCVSRGHGELELDL